MTAQQILTWDAPVGPPPSLPEPRAGKTQGRMKPAEIKQFLEKISLQPIQAFKPASLSTTKDPTTKLFTPEFARKPEFAATLAKRFPELPDPVKKIYERAVLTNSNQYPWCTIGKVFAGKNLDFNSPEWTGSGVLVGEFDVLLTAGHVVPWNQPGWWMRFVPAYDNSSEPFGSSYVSDAYSYNPTDTVEPYDYAVCKLYTPLTNVGYMGAQSWEDDGDYTTRIWTSVGYPGAILNAQVPIVDTNIAIIHVQDDANPDSKLLETNFFGFPGWSGGPMWNYLDNQPRVVGVMSGYEGNEQYSLTAAGQAMLNLILWAIANWK